MFEIDVFLCGVEHTCTSGWWAWRGVRTGCLELKEASKAELSAMEGLLRAEGQGASKAAEGTISSSLYLAVSI